MRILFLFIVIIFSSFVLGGVGVAGMLEEDCHEEQMAGHSGPVMDCCCEMEMQNFACETDKDLLLGHSCCIPQTCATHLVSKEFVSNSSLSSRDLQIIERELFVNQPGPLVLANKTRLQTSPIRPPPGPLFTLHCSFLI